MLSGLNVQQRDAILGSLNTDSLVLAGAGSGKTRVLTLRVQYLMNKLSVDPGSIVAITFTRKAANELKDRLKGIASPDEVAQLWVGTYHSICLKIIDSFGEYIGIKEGYTILDPQNARKCAADVLEKMGLETSKKTVTDYLKKVSSLKNNVVFPKTFKQRVLNKYSGDIDRASTDSEYIFAEFYSNYTRENLKNNVLDFDDIIVYTILLLSSNEQAQRFVKSRFQYIHSDEVQDSNPSNFVLLSLLSKHCNLFMVGDVDQSIYGFRGARPDLITSYSNGSKKLKIFKLEQNYRSTQTIVDASNCIIAHNSGRIEKTCFSTKEVGEKISLAVCDNNIEEASYVAKRIKGLKESGKYKYEDMMILYRTNAQSRVFEEVLLRENIPYSLVGATSFNERAEIKDCMAVLKLACNLKDKYSFKRALGTLESVGKKAIEDMMLLMDVKQDAVEVLSEYKAKTKKAQESLWFLQNVLNIIDKKPTAVLDKVADYYIERLMMVNDEKAIDRIENIKELQNVVKEKENEGLALHEFVMQMDLMSSADNVADADTITMMTIHASKGLESPVVFMVGMNNGLLPHENNLYTEKGLHEERRLAYVGVTRAEERLFLSRYCVDTRNKYEESMFLKEIPMSFLEYDDILFN